jgi:hypothetical protein
MTNSNQISSHKYSLLSAILLLTFSFLAIAVVMKGDSSIVKWDSSLFHMINSSSHNKAEGEGGVVMDQLMVILTQYGREAVWGAVLFFFLSLEEQKVEGLRS